MAGVSVPGNATRFPLGGRLTLEELTRDPHPALAELREHEPVSRRDSEP